MNKLHGNSALKLNYQKGQIEYQGHTDHATFKQARQSGMTL